MDLHSLIGLSPINLEALILQDLVKGMIIAIPKVGILENAVMIIS